MLYFSILLVFACFMSGAIHPFNPNQNQTQLSANKVKNGPVSVPKICEIGTLVRSEILSKNTETKLVTPLMKGIKIVSKVGTVNGS